MGEVGVEFHHGMSDHCRVGNASNCRVGRVGHIVHRGEEVWLSDIHCRVPNRMRLLAVGYRHWGTSDHVRNEMGALGNGLIYMWGVRRMGHMAVVVGMGEFRMELHSLHPGNCAGRPIRIVNFLEIRISHWCLEYPMLSLNKPINVSKALCSEGYFIIQDLDEELR